jgi:DNA-binding transcriptional LysR family regulator
MVNIESVDLNLLLVLHVVLEERNATRAAKRLHVTQSAVSNSLARLRELLGDPLLVRNARGLSPTPRALALKPLLSSMMRGAADVLNKDAAFEPASSSHEHSLACADYYSAVILPPLMALLRARSPRARLRLVSLDQLIASDGLANDIDLHIGMAPKLASGCTAQALFDDRFVCLANGTRAGGRPGKLSLERYLGSEHVRVSVLGSRFDPIDTMLAERGLSRNVVLTVPYFSVVPLVVHQTGLLATLSRRLAEVYARLLPLQLLEPPLVVSQRAVKMTWHKRNDSDPAARFFRALVEEVTSRPRDRA